jgi:demethylmenaquinone methyltransferase/2-methoxy-6-polyprenyl-1,4-benzoquinol methylase
MSNNDLSGAELINPYDDRRDKAQQVEQMFDSIAPAYDFMNTAMTFGLHRWWRKRALDDAAKSTGNPASILDIATGTGDVAFDLQRRYPNSSITGIDLSEGMLKIARKKLAKADEDDVRLNISFEQGDSLHMRFADNSFDLITVAYGVRNFEHLAQGLAEMARVLRHDGTLCIIELSEPVNPLTKSLYRFYSRKLIPLVGRIVSGDSRAYTYLPESIAAAPQREEMTSLLYEAGFKYARFRSLTFGAVTYYIATK